MRIAPVLLALSLIAASMPAAAQEWSAQDGLLVDAAAMPRAGLLRASVGGAGGPAADGGGSSSALVSVLYAGSSRFLVGLEAYEQDGTAEPSGVMRYQLASQAGRGFDLALQGRYKKVGFTSDGGEVEAGVNLGRRWGGFDAVLDAVYGHDTDGEGSDLEGKIGAGWSFSSRFRAGVEGRLQRALSAEADHQDPDAVSAGRDFDLLAGPTVAWAIADSIRVQALAGIGAPRGSTKTGPAGLLLASFDF